MSSQCRTVRVRLVQSPSNTCVMDFGQLAAGWCERDAGRPCARSIAAAPASPARRLPWPLSPAAAPEPKPRNDRRYVPTVSQSSSPFARMPRLIVAPPSLPLDRGSNFVLMRRGKQASRVVVTRGRRARQHRGAVQRRVGHAQPLQSIERETPKHARPRICSWQDCMTPHVCSSPGCMSCAALHTAEPCE